MELRKIAQIENNFSSKFGVPRQSGLIPESKGKIVFEAEYSVFEAVRGLEKFSHIWVLWGFSEVDKTGWSPTVRPPLLGGNKRIGVFATRSPYRPNPIGISVLKLEGIEKNGGSLELIVSGCDMMDKTPIYDIKPYLPYADSIKDAIGGFTEDLDERRLTVEIPDELLNIIPENLRAELEAVLMGDPRPSYQNDPNRIYGMEFADMEIKFLVENKTLIVKDVKNL